MAAEIPATLLAAKAGVNRSRLSNLERGYAQPTEEELQRLTSALEQLIDAKAAIQKTAATVGWPFGEVR
ncbi:MAG: helix-turn-helix transcriptional regulator [Acidobacteria bacterium]|nr:helix-turn-helix transcriptional regulator [Acidobacteriota bacterium]